MIKCINKIEGFGIFKNYSKSKSIPDFSKYNLFYGWNGSGKSTLSRVLSAIERKTIPPEFDNCKLEIELIDGSKITTDTISKTDIKVKVFNREFILDNIDFDNQDARSILIVSKERIEDKNKLIELKKEQQDIRQEAKLIENKLEEEQKQNEKYLTEVARSIKNAFKIIDTKDTYYFNYDRGKLSRFIDQNRSLINQNAILAEEEVQRIVKSVKPEVKNVVNFQDIALEINLMIEFESRLIELVNTSIISKQISKLAENDEINSWVEAGLELHKKNNSFVCEFCDQLIPIGRLEELGRHFNEDYIHIKQKAAAGIDYINRIKDSLTINLPEDDSFYDEYKDEFKSKKEKFKESLDNVKQLMNGWGDLLGKKMSNPFDILATENIELAKPLFEIVDLNIQDVKNLIALNNEKTANFATMVKNNQYKLELHYVSEALLSSKYLEKIIEQGLSERKKQDLIVAAEEKEKPIKQIEKILVNAVLGADKFNDSLNLFLGRNDIMLDYVNEEGGYKIVRSGDKKPARNLSEGEKTAIAFVYFMSKLEEMDASELKETIVALDDPISSFDSNHLFTSAHFIKDAFFSEDEADSIIGQVFILSHNFNFFSLINEWFESKAKNKQVFSIKSIAENTERVSTIENAEAAIKYFNSEYHFIFSEVKSYCESTTKAYFHTHTVANLSRQLLESFLTFKYGRKKLDNCFNEIKGFAEIAKVRKFVNHYSHRANHGQNIKGFNDNVFAETDKLVPLVLDLIKHVDSVHYNSMMARLNGN